MARLQVALLAVVLGALLASPSTGAFVQANGKKDLTAVCDCLRKDGRFTTWLSLFESSGFKEIVARYLMSQPLTVIVATDAAFKKLPGRIRKQLRGSKLIRYMESNMLLHKLPADYIRMVLKSAYFDTALGTPLYKVASADPKVIALSPVQTPTSRAQIATVTKADMCGLRHLTLVVQVVDTVILPPGLLTSATH